MLTLISPAPDLGLLTIEELRAAVGVSDSSRDAALTAMGLRVAGEIASFCRIARAGVAPPTLRAETVEEVWRLTDYRQLLILSRRFVSSVVSIAAAGEAVGSDLQDLDGPAGLLRRLDECDRNVCWSPGKVVVRYVAGFAAVPDDLKACATDLVRQMDSGSARDPLLRAEQIDGIGRWEYQIASGMTMSGGIPADIAARLSTYVSVSV